MVLTCSSEKTFEVPHGFKGRETLHCFVGSVNLQNLAPSYGGQESRMTLLLAFT